MIVVAVMAEYIGGTYYLLVVRELPGKWLAGHRTGRLFVLLFVQFVAVVVVFMAETGAWRSVSCADDHHRRWDSSFRFV